MTPKKSRDAVKTDLMGKMKRLAIEIETMRLKRLHGDYVPMIEVIKKKQQFKTLQTQYKKIIYEKNTT